MRQKIDVEGNKLHIFSGFETGFSHCENNGLFLKLDISHKVVRKDSILDYINEIY